MTQPEQPRTDAGRAMLQAWARRSWSREALRQAIRAIEAEAALPVPALDALRIEEAVCRSEIAGSGHATGDIPCEWHTAAGNVRVQRFITALGSQEDVT